MVAIFCAFLLSTDCSLQASGGKKSEHYFRIHLQAGEGENPNYVLAVPLTNPDQIITIKRVYEISEKNIMAMSKLESGHILVEFDRSGTNILESFTSTNVGAIMVVLFNGRVLYSPMIDIPLRTGQLVLPAQCMSDQELKSFQGFLAKQKKR